MINRKELGRGLDALAARASTVVPGAMTARRRHVGFAVASVVAVAAVAVAVTLQVSAPPATSRDWSRPVTVAGESVPVPAKKARPATRPRPLITVDGKQLMLDGRPAFITGVAYPGRSNQDFGDGGWGHAGVSNPTTTAEVDADFANMAAQGVRVVKWNVFDDGRYSPEFDARGAVMGLDERFFADLDAAIDLAEQHDLYLVLSLVSDRFWTTKETENGVALGGHAATLTDPALRATFVERAIVPMLQHLAYTDRVLAYEIFDLPEFGIKGLNQDNDGRIRIPLAAAQAAVKGIAAAVHAHTVALATVSSNRASHMKHWRGLDLDHYSFNQQDWVEPYEPLATDAAKHGLDRPIVVTVPAAGSAQRGLGRAFDLVKQHGYAGVFAASYLMPAGKASWHDAADAFMTWQKQHWGEMSLTGRQPPGD